MESYGTVPGFFTAVAYLKEVLSTVEEEKQTLELIYKWRCDRSQTQYKQRFENAMGSNIDTFQSSVVLLQLI
ncbi:hypothetical protein ABEB36_002976 [Hypothenemus hampei]|uniref:Uncharacterized protein n=1 Tax=Hypothenemus hampei TaxID=57062 RepID=A0ABD1F7L9_HYPHA